MNAKKITVRTEEENLKRSSDVTTTKNKSEKDEMKIKKRDKPEATSVRVVNCSNFFSILLYCPEYCFIVIVS